MPNPRSWLFAGIVLCAFLVGKAAAQMPEQPRVAASKSVEEARARAVLLHETIHGTLQVVHRDFFEEDDSRVIPSASLEDVFHALSKAYNVDVKWLVVETDVVNVDHQAESEFEKKAVAVLADRKPYWEDVEGERYRFAGPIRLASQCLKCHVRNRKDTKDRVAGLVIEMPIQRPQTDANN